MNNSKAYILNINYENWSNQLWFENEDTIEVQNSFNEAIKNLEKLKKESEDCYDYQNKVIEYFKTLGFLRIQK
ncbi:MAG: hypothetical protein HFJ33_05720 [Clostridia bacterium]|nr:hypothetical protein [Clostridia bacterium]